MAKKKFANDPLLFIHQPSVSTPKAPMQDSYISPKRQKKNKSVEQPSDTSEPAKEIPKRRYSAKKVLNEEPPSEKEEKKEEKHDVPLNQRKQFKDMSVRERIHYFLDTSEYAPKVKCEIKTEKKSYRGFIMDFKDEMVFVQVGRKMIEISFEDIYSVRLLGF
ncbi:CotO family spore coat protein [Oceanobacillus senegalensis]|uniref:CotO family spore coat protein n=1 Tax=Oceanobacillus senegalensis TaxID=1936063 RepID=UPI000A309713|nr:CotO family spore coat protein [Oceanobacillus senegalensis]